jgi:hypothetical protein
MGKSSNPTYYQLKEIEELYYLPPPVKLSLKSTFKIRKEDEESAYGGRVPNVTFK